MQKITPEYVVGLVDGEGSFTVYVKDVNIVSSKRRVRVEPKFYLKLVERDKDILYNLQKFFDCGSVYFQKDKRPNHQNCYRYEVYNRNDLTEKIIPFFQKNRLRLTSKKSDFEIFSKIMEMIQRKDHFTKSGLRKMHMLKQKMH